MKSADEIVEEKFAGNVLKMFTAGDLIKVIRQAREEVREECKQKAQEILDLNIRLGAGEKARTAATIIDAIESLDLK